jgi:hypothetical protein
MRWIRQRSPRSPEPPPLLGVQIFVSDDLAYAVEIDRLNEQIGNVELVRLVLHYFAEVLYRCSASDGGRRPTAIELRLAMARACASTPRDAMDLLGAAGLGGARTVDGARLATAAHRIRATLYFVSLSHRGMRVEFPERLPARHAMGSVFVLMHEVLARLTQSDSILLWKSLTHMQAMYAAGYAYTDAGNLSLVPNEALGMV